MNQPWRIKNLALQVLNRVPLSVHNFVSQSITHRATREMRDTYLDIARFHSENIRRCVGIEETVIEFGAGKDAFYSVFLAMDGYKNIVAVDLNRLISRKDLNHLCDQISSRGISTLSLAGDTEGFLSSMGITYRAPFDMRATGLPDNAVGAIMSTDTLEHIASSDIEKIISECYRVLRPGGVCSFSIDYSDHYSHTDTAIGPYNFLTFSSKQWKKYSPANHFQNRLRHRDYEQMFKEKRFTIISSDAARSENWAEELDALSLSNEFQSYTKDDLSWTSGQYLLRK